MTFPPDLPSIVYYRVGGVILTALPRVVVEAIGSGGDTNAKFVRPRIPLGADAWCKAGGDWQPLDAIPEHWRPYLDRKRGTFMDPRPPLE